MFSWEHFKNGESYVSLYNKDSYTKFTGFCAKHDIVWRNGENILTEVTSENDNGEVFGKNGIRHFRGNGKFSYYVCVDGRLSSCGHEATRGLCGGGFVNLTFPDEVTEDGFEAEIM